VGDWPHTNLKDHMPEDGPLVDFIPHIATTAALQRKLLVDNPDTPVLAGGVLKCRFKSYLDVPAPRFLMPSNPARDTT